MRCVMKVAPGLKMVKPAPRCFTVMPIAVSRSDVSYWSFIMKMQKQILVSLAAAALASAAVAQTATTSVSRAASAAVTPGDENMGRNPDNRSGGLMGQDSAVRSGSTSAGNAAKAAVTPGDQYMGRNSSNRTGGLMGADRTRADGTSTPMPSGSNPGMRAARADRG